MSEKEKTVISWPQSGRTWLITMIGKVFYDYMGECDLATKFSDYFGRDIKNLGSYNLHTFPREHEDQAWLKEPQEIDSDKSHLNDMYKKGRTLPSNIFDVIFLVRHPRDTLVSNYIRKNQKIKNPTTKFTGTSSEFIRHDKGSLRSMIYWLNLWTMQRNKMRNYLLVRYEDLHSQGEKELRKIIDFIGYNQIPDSIIADAVEFANIQNMRKMEQKEGGKNHIMFSKDKQFVGQGKIGHGKDFFSTKDNDFITYYINMLYGEYGYGPYEW